MSDVADFGTLVAAVVLVLMLWFVVKGLRRGNAQKDWPQARATVIQAELSEHDGLDVSRGLHLVKAQLRTEDRRSTTGWAQGAYGGGDEWIGRAMPAWHDPAQPEDFRLTQPHGYLRGFVEMMPGLLIMVVVAAGFVLITLAARG